MTSFIFSRALKPSSLSRCQQTSFFKRTSACLERVTAMLFFLQSSRNRVDLLSYESKPTDNTTGGLEKIWTGMHVFPIRKTSTQPHCALVSVHVCVYTYICGQTTPCPSKFFSGLQSFCCRLFVVLLSYDSRSTLIRRDCTKKIGRVLKMTSFIFSRALKPSRSLQTGSAYRLDRRKKMVECLRVSLFSDFLHFLLPIRKRTWFLK